VISAINYGQLERTIWLMQINPDASGDVS